MKTTVQKYLLFIFLLMHLKICKKVMQKYCAKKAWKKFPLKLNFFSKLNLTILYYYYSSREIMESLKSMIMNIMMKLNLILPSLILMILHIDRLVNPHASSHRQAR